MDQASVLAASMAVILLTHPVAAGVASVLRKLSAGPARRLTGIIVLCAAAGSFGRPFSAEAALPPPSARSVGVQPAAPAPGYTVQEGDSLWSIACRWLQASGARPTDLEIDRTWRAIYASNRSTIGDDPDLIHPGVVLTIPEVRA